MSVRRNLATLALMLGALSGAVAQTPRVETAAIRPTAPGDTNWRMEFLHGRMRIENRTVRDLIKAAYGLPADSQVQNAPPWVLTQHFDVSGTFDDTLAKDIDSGTPDQRSAVIAQLLRGLLADRFQLQAHDAQVMLPVYALTVTRHGTHLQSPQDHPERTFHGIVGPPGRLDAHGVSMATLASRLTSMRAADERLVIDETGMPGTFDWSLRWNSRQLSTAADTGQDDAPSLFTALEEQLGLRLVSKKSKVPAVIIDHISQPSEN